MEEGWNPDACDGLRSVHKTWGMSQNCPTLSSVATKAMAFVSWSVHPLYDEQDKEFFTSADDALDVALDWSAETHGRTMIIQRDGQEWMWVTA